MPTSSNTRFLATAIALGLFAAGCGREAITSYKVPKEDHAVKVAAAHNHAEADAEAAADPLPKLSWTLPPGWEQTAGESMGGARFRVKGDEDKMAEVRIVPLPGAAAAPDMAERAVEMWRTELKLPAEAEAKTNTVEVAGSTAKFFELTSIEPTFQGKYKARIAAAVLPRANVLWFIKISGEDSLVAAQQASFRDFLKSLKFQDVAAEAPAHPVAQAAGDAPKAKWPGPPNWTSLPARQMVLAAYSVKSGAGQAEITVTSFPGDVGGLLANVNRWRGQVQLPPISAGELATTTKELSLTDGSKATEVRLKGVSSTLYGLIVPRGGQTWFYKMLGDETTVSAEAPHLVEFAATAK